MTRKELISAIINDSSEELEAYIVIDGEKIPCSRQLYLEYKRQFRKERKREQRIKKPMINGKRCKGDCDVCRYFDGHKCIYGGIVSIDDLPTDGADAPRTSQNVVEEAVVNVTISQMYKALDGEGERVISIFNLMLEEKPQREIAETLDISDGTVTYYIKRIRQKLEKFR